MARGERTSDQLPLMVPVRFDASSRAGVLSQLAHGREPTTEQLAAHRDLSLRVRLARRLQSWARSLSEPERVALEELEAGRAADPDLVERALSARAPRALVLYAPSPIRGELAIGDRLTLRRAQTATLTRHAAPTPPALRGLDADTKMDTATLVIHLPAGSRGAYLPAAYADSTDQTTRLRRMLVALPEGGWVLPAGTELQVTAIESSSRGQTAHCQPIDG